MLFSKIWLSHFCALTSCKYLVNTDGQSLETFQAWLRTMEGQGQTKGDTKDLVGVKSIRCKIYIPFNYVRDYLTDHRIIAVWERLQESQIYISMLST